MKLCRGLWLGRERGNGEAEGWWEMCGAAGWVLAGVLLLLLLRSKGETGTGEPLRSAPPPARQATTGRPPSSPSPLLPTTQPGRDHCPGLWTGHVPHFCGQALTLLPHLLHPTLLATCL